MAGAVTGAGRPEILHGVSTDVESPLVEYHEEDVTFLQSGFPAPPSSGRAEVDRLRRVRPATLVLGLGLLVCCVAFARGRSSSDSGSSGKEKSDDAEASSEQAVVWSVGSLVGVEDDACHTARPGESCFDKVMYAMHEGVQEHPEWYGGLDDHSNASDFQKHFRATGYGSCQRPCRLGEADRAWKPKDNCLCIFDIDRTLTSKQSLADKCPGAKAFGYFHDNAYGGGQLVLSQLALDLESTFCSKCHLGAVSAGTTGPDEQELIASLLSGTDPVWSPMWSVHSSLVVNCSDAKKAQCAGDIWNWLKKSKKADIPQHEVFFFDDQTVNSRDFEGKGFNARQVSCQSRDWSTSIGACGAESSEIVREIGIKTCDSLPDAPRHQEDEEEDEEEQDDEQKKDEGSQQKVKVRTPDEHPPTEEQHHAHGAMRKRGKAVEGASPDIVEAFTVYDANINNLISKEEFCHTNSLLNGELESEEVRKKFDEADADGDGQLNYQEFVEWMQEA